MMRMMRVILVPLALFLLVVRAARGMRVVVGARIGHGQRAACSIRRARATC
jgi:hypothetical protein